ncbi:hypothetical protein EON83_27775 [bacterium]|nr:MAG: hypothetical protein EON83_27775 [bacterium]
MSAAPLTPEIPAEVAAQVALLTRQSWGRRTQGYHHEKVKHMLRSSTLFRAWLSVLPADLTDVDLSPLYVIAETGEDVDDLRRMEKAWEPDTSNLKASYNGPIGEDGRPLPTNVRKWQDAVEAAQSAHMERFQQRLNRMEGCDIPERLKDAAENLASLALDIERQRMERRRDEFDGCASSDDIVGIDAAIRLCFSALCELDARARQSAQASLEMFRENVADISEVLGGEA